MPTFYLHAGMHKTASSSCQQLFAEKREDLADTGLDYFEGPDDNHSFFLLSLFDINRPYFEKLKASGYLKTEYSDRDALNERFRTFVTASDNDKLFSAESAFLMNADQVRSLRDDYLQGHDLKMLALVRPPLSFAASAAQQSLKGGQIFSRMLDNLPVPKYRIRFEQYLEVLGRENLSFEIFHPSRLKNRDPAQTLLDMMGRTDFDEWSAPRRNKSMSATAAKLLSIMNAALEDAGHLDRIPPKIRTALRGLPEERYQYAQLEDGRMKGGLLARRLMRIAQRTPGPRFKLPVEIRAATAEASRKDAAWMAEVLGHGIRGFDTKLDDDAPSLSDAETFTEEETETAVNHFNAAPKSWRDLVPEAAS